MKDNGYLEQLKKAIEYAKATGSFNKRNILKNVENICVFGLGKYFREAFIQQNVMGKYHVNMICDNNYNKVKELCKEEKLRGIKGISVDELKKLDSVAVIIMLGDPREVECQLKDLGIKNVMTYNDLSVDLIMEIPSEKEWFEENENDIFKAYECLSDDESKKVFVNVICNRIAPKYSKYAYEKLYSKGEYFDSGLFQLNYNECFVDCGAYDGDTLKSFIATVDGEFDSIYAFELDKNNYLRLNDSIIDYDLKIKNKIKCYNCGVWNENGEMSYGKETEYDSAEGLSLYKSNNMKKAHVVKLDDILGNNRVSFIKMDIEGAEQNALKGAENIIKNYKPKISVCLYHKIDDFWRIPLYLKEIVPEYKISVRHHYYYNCWGTVCYAYI